MDIMLIRPIEEGRTGAIYFLVGVVVVQISVIPVVLMLVRCIRSLISKQAALELTPDYYIDNMENVKLAWKDISEIWIKEKQYSFLTIKLVDNSILYNKASRMWKYVFWMNNLNRDFYSRRGALSINLALLKGKNKEILEIISEYQLRVAKITGNADN